MKRLCVSLLLLICLLQGCSGSGFDKRATLMPDRIGISVGEQRLLPHNVAWRGVIVNLTWELK